MNHASIFTPDKELKLWSSGAVGTYSPMALVRAVFFYTLGKTLRLRGGQELRELKPSKPSKLQREHDPDHYSYVENGS